MAHVESRGLTVASVGKMTTYELRQEVEKRGLLVEIQNVNHETLLRRLVKVIVEEEHERGRQSVQNTASIEADNNAHKRLHLERKERKEAAIERSKQRQASGDYFQAKKLSNVRDKQEQQPKATPKAMKTLKIKSPASPRLTPIVTRSLSDDFMTSSNTKEACEIPRSTPIAL